MIAPFIIITSVLMHFFQYFFLFFFGLLNLLYRAFCGLTTLLGATIVDHDLFFAASF